VPAWEGEGFDGPESHVGGLEVETFRRGPFQTDDGIERGRLSRACWRWRG
jgi:hypothetical protein